MQSYRTLLLAGFLGGLLLVPAAPTAAQDATPPAMEPASLPAAAPCDTMQVLRVWPGGSFTNTCPNPAYVVSEPFYDRLLSDYNTLPAALASRALQAEINTVLDEKFGLLNATHQELLRLNSQLSTVSMAALDASISSIDSTSQTLTRTTTDLSAANRELQQSIRDLRRVRFNQFLRIAGAFAGGLVVGFVASR